MQMIAYNTKRGPLGRDELVRILYTIARRRVVDWYDRADNLLLCPSDDVLLTEAAVEAAMDLVDGVAVRVDIERALERLSRQQQRALVLVYLERATRTELITVAMAAA